MTHSALSHFNLDARHGAHERTILDRFCRISGAADVGAGSILLPGESASSRLTEEPSIYILRSIPPGSISSAES